MGTPSPMALLRTRNCPQWIRCFANFGLEVRQAINQLVLRTTTGSAQPVAAALDRERLPEVLGTIAGDDTVLIICQDQTLASQLRQRLEELLEA